MTLLCSSYVTHSSAKTLRKLDLTLIQIIDISLSHPIYLERPVSNSYVFANSKYKQGYYDKQI